jgi:hypothetical protein
MDLRPAIHWRLDFRRWLFDVSRQKSDRNYASLFNSLAISWRESKPAGLAAMSSISPTRHGLRIGLICSPI